MTILVESLIDTGPSYERPDETIVLETRGRAEADGESFEVRITP